MTRSIDRSSQPTAFDTQHSHKSLLLSPHVWVVCCLKNVIIQVAMLLSERHVKYLTFVLISSGFEAFMIPPIPRASPYVDF